jgi:feruloyl-CoA synthase
MSKQSSKLTLAEVAVISEQYPNGDIIFENKIPLPASNETMLDKMEFWAQQKPDAPFLHERKGNEWQNLSYLEFFKSVQQTAQHLNSIELNQEKPLLILAPNSIDHTIVAYAALYLGIPVSPVSPAYALMARTFDRLQQIIDILRPGAIYVSNAELFARAADFVSENYATPILCSTGKSENLKLISELAPADLSTIEKRRAQVGPETLAKIMFTSGSTGAPKGVLNSHEMMYSNQQALAAIWPFLNEDPPNITDWLPWSHTFGGNVSFNSVLYHGGELFIDDGKPTPQLIDRTVANLKQGKPNLHFNVPAGVEALLPKLEADADFAKQFFSNLNVLFVAAAALPQKARERINTIAEKVGVDGPLLLAGWGSTETAPFATGVYFKTDRADNIGLPMPGTKIKMTPNQDKLELCVKGPNVTQGYWNNPEATKSAFDEEGFYRMGDAGQFIDPDKPEQGIFFNGRISENFKLLSGTWVNVGMLRVAAIDCLRPLCTDVVVTGQNKADIGLMLVPNFSYIEKNYPFNANKLNARALFESQQLIDDVISKINRYNKDNRSNSTAIRRATFLPRMPELDRSEVTDKGYLNQRKILENWAELVEAMHDQSTQDVIFYRAS